MLDNDDVQVLNSSKAVEAINHHSSQSKEKHAMMDSDVERFMDSMSNHFKQALLTKRSDGHYLEGIVMASQLSEVSIIWKDG